MSDSLTDRIDVLDHGYVRLCDHMGNDLTVVRRARHMPDAEWRGERDIKLINYLMKHRHTSPFEFCSFDFHAKLPVFVARQWMRHRVWQYNEISGRYQELPEEFYVPDPWDYGKQSKSNHQGREDIGLYDNLEDGSLWQKYQEGFMKAAFALYREHIADGMPRELARIILPLATYTEISAKVDLHNLFHFLTLRLDNHAQYEIRVYAQAILQLIEPIVPVCIAAWRENSK